VENQVENQALQTPLEGCRSIYLATEFQANSGSIRISSRELSRHGSTRICHHSFTLFL